MDGYTIHLSRYDNAKEPNAFFNIASLENNGIGNLSVPRKIIDMFLEKRHMCFVLEEDLTSRFVPGFKIQAINEEGSFTYTVAQHGCYVRPHEDKLTTVIPIEEKILHDSYDSIAYETPTVYTSLYLTGNSVSSYNQTLTWGNALLNNIVRMLEHFARDLPPVAPLEGQLWFDTTTKQLRVFVGEKFPMNTTINNTVIVDGPFIAGEQVVIYDNRPDELDSRVYVVNRSDGPRVCLDEFIPTGRSGMIYNLNQWQVVQGKDVDTSAFASKEYVDGRIKEIDSSTDIDQLIEAVAAVNAHLANLPEPPQPLTIEEIKKHIPTTVPYDISLFVYQIEDTPNDVASSVLMTRDVQVLKNDIHTIRVLTPPEVNVALELITITDNHESAAGLITVEAGSMKGVINLYDDINLQPGDLLVLRSLEVDLTARNVFITLRGSTPS